VMAAIDRVLDACERAGRAVGIFGATAAALEPFAERGFSLLLAGADTLVLAEGMRRFADALREQR
jgi:2-dehydro-3-deoxyglucarate aldolase